MTKRFNNGTIHYTVYGDINYYYNGERVFRQVHAKSNNQEGASVRRDANLNNQRPPPTPQRSQQPPPTQQRSQQPPPEQRSQQPPPPPQRSQLERQQDSLVELTEVVHQLDQRELKAHITQLVDEYLQEYTAGEQEQANDTSTGSSQH